MKFYTYKLSEQAKQELAIGDFENESILVESVTIMWYNIQ